MGTSDPLADFLTAIRNGLKAQHRFIDIRWSKLKQNLAEILKDEGLIESFLVKNEGNKGQMRVYLKYDGRSSVIQGLRRYSKPGCRKYITCDQIPQFYGGLGIPVLSTSRGVMSGQKARQQRLGGELLCLVW